MIFVFLISVTEMLHSNSFPTTPFPKCIPDDYADVEDYVYFIENGKFGYMDNTGKMVIPAKFSYARHFHEKLAAASVEEGKCGFIDKAGKFVIPPKFFNCEDFSDGIAFVYTMQGGKKNWFLINKEGKTVPIPEFQYYGKFSEGLCNVIASDGKWGYIDKTGKYFVQPIYNNAGPFHEGLANVEVGRVSGFIDTTGKMVIEPQFITVGFMNFSGGLTTARFKQNRDNGLYQIGFINKKGELQDTRWLKKLDEITTTNPIYAINNPNEGLSILCTSFHDKLWAIIDMQGNMIMDFKHFDLLYDFQNGFAAFQEFDENHNGKWGYINKQGEIAIKPQFKLVGSFMKNGLAWVTFVIDKKEYQGYINKNGEVIKKWFMYDVAE